MAKENNPTIVIDGERVEENGETPETRQGRPRERFLVRINDLPVPLRGRSFSVFTLLALARRAGEGWLPPEYLLPQPETVGRRLYDMKSEVRSILRDGGDIGYDLRCWPVIEKQRVAQYAWEYRLCTSPDSVHVANPMAIADFGQHELLLWLTPREIASARLQRPD